MSQARLQAASQSTPQFAAAMELERHAGECRDMAWSAYEPTHKAAFARLADALERRAEALDETVWLKHAMAAASAPPALHFFR